MGSGVSFDPVSDIPSLAGKVIFITGGTAGLGEQTILLLAKHNPQQLHFTGRNSQSAESVIDKVKKIAANVQVHFHECDQTSLASVNAAANSFLSTNTNRLDVLICNAGRMGGPPGLTKDGYEVQWGINYLSHALLTKRFLPLLEQTASEQGEARIVNLTSEGYTMHIGGIPFDKLKTTQEDIGMMGKWARYAQSKFALVPFTSELAKRHPKITSIAVNPGVAHTGLVENLPLWDRLFVKAFTFGRAVPLEQGAYNTCWAATTENRALKSGAVYYPVGVFTEHTKAASDEGVWKDLWEWTGTQLESFV